MKGMVYTSHRNCFVIFIISHTRYDGNVFKRWSQLK